MSNPIEDTRPRAVVAVAAAVLVTAVAIAQLLYMGPAVWLLDVGLVVAYGAWFVGLPYRGGRPGVLPAYLAAVAVQAVHFGEESLSGFADQFPRVMGTTWSGRQFVTLNFIWLAVFVLAGWGIHRGRAIAFLAAWFLALVGGIANGVGHLGLSLAQGRYFPGSATAPLCLVAGVILVRQLTRRGADKQ